MRLILAGARLSSSRLHDTVLRHLEIGSNFDLYLKVKGVDHPLRMRTGKSSDRGVLRQIFTNREYESVQLTNPLTIIDLGANVGYSSAYFLSRYAEAKVISIEPDPSNFRLLQQNLAPYATRSLDAAPLYRLRLVDCQSRKASSAMAESGRLKSRFQARQTNMATSKATISTTSFRWPIPIKWTF